MNHQTELYAVPGRNTIIDTINPATDRTHYADETAEQVRARYPEAVRMTIAEWTAAVIARQTTPITWEPTTAEAYHEMLEVLPPALWIGGAFLVGEPQDHAAADGAPRFAGYLHHGGAYFVASRPVTRAELRAELARLVGGSR
jgi:hypothetical protein